MPNWCDQELVVRGKKADIDNFIEFAKTEKKCLDENQFIPMPNTLIEVPAGSVEEIYHVWYGSLESISQYTWIPDEIKCDREKLKLFFKDHYKDSEHSDVEALANKYKHNMDNYGALTWYDWAIKNWGTKWGISEPESTRRKRSVVYTFSSAWSPIEPIVTKMSGKSKRK
jgi:hypothetical protein